MVLKGARTLVAAPDGRVSEDPHEVPALGTGGSDGVGTPGSDGAGTGGPPPSVPPPVSLQFDPRIWSMSWSTAPHLPRMASMPAGPSDWTKMFAQWLGTPFE